MHRFLVEAIGTGAQEAIITGEEAFHLNRVLRLRPGEIIEVGDGKGHAFRAELTRSHPILSRARLLGPVEDCEPALRLTLAQALAKGEKMELIIQKGTELGVHTFVPFTSKRAIVKLAGEKLNRRRARWERIAREAAKQCGRSVIPRVEAPVTLEEVLTRFAKEGTLVILPWEGEKDQGLNNVLGDAFREAKNEALIIIGPEGGFATDEVELAADHGARVVSLGPRILRTETAALAVVTMTLYVFGDLGALGES